MLTNYYEIDENTSIESFLKEVNDKKNSHYIVLDTEPKAFVDIRTLALKSHNNGEKLRNLKRSLSRSKGTSRTDHFNFLVDTRERIIDTAEGYFTFQDALNHILEEDHDFLNNTIDSLDIKEVYALNEEDTLAHAKNLFTDNKINMLPVISDMKITGELRPRDFLFDGIHNESTMNMPVSNLSNKKPIMVSKDSVLREAVEKMVDKSLPSLIVHDKDEIYSVISYKDIFKLVKESKGEKIYGVEFSGTSNLYDDEIELIQKYCENTMEKISKKSIYDTLKVKFKTIGNTEGTHKRKIEIKFMLMHGKKVLTLDKTASCGTSDEIYNDKRKQDLNIVKITQEALRSLEKKVSEEKKRSKN